MDCEYCKQGLFLNLPCKIGDTVYRPIPNLYRKYTENIVTEIIIKENAITFKTDKGIEWDIDTIGKTIFLSKEEAEQKLSATN